MPICPECGHTFTVHRKPSEKANAARRRSALLGGPKPKVSKQDLVSIFKSRTKWTAGEFQNAVEYKTGIKYDRSHAAKLLKDLKSPARRLIQKGVKKAIALLPRRPRRTS